MDNFTLSDLLDLTAVAKMAESHYQSTGMPVGIIDAFDDSVLAGVGWQEICLKFHRSNPDSLKRCHASDNYIKENLKIGEACRYKCKNGLWDIGIPIVVMEKHLATLFIGQFFYEGEAPDKKFFIEQAYRFGYDSEDYLRALDKVPAFTYEKVESILDYDKALATFLMDLAEKSLLKKIADDKLRKAQNYISNVINSIPSILIGIDNNGKITQWNRKAELITGQTFEQVELQSFETVLPYLKNQMPFIKKSIQNNEVIKNLKIPFADQNKTRFEDITIFPLVDNHIEGAVIQIDDVTEKIQLEEMLIQNEKMLSVGGLAAGMAHEINNPLSGVIQNANVLSSRLTDMNIPANVKAARSAGTTMESIQKFMGIREVPKLIKAITDSGARVAGIVSNMLSFARKSDSSFSSHDPSELLDRALDLATTDYNLKKHYDFKSISIQKEYEDHLPLISCEAGKIQQVLLNILKNGAYAMFEMGKHEGARSPEFILRLSNQKQSGMLQIEIEDNGTGMDEITRKKIFEPFFTTKPVGSGTGLGLSVAYFIITENHGGTMDVVSEPGKGSNFIIRLPMDPQNNL